MFSYQSACHVISCFVMVCRFLVELLEKDPLVPVLTAMAAKELIPMLTRTSK